jgi:hypothetical protein
MRVLLRATTRTAAAASLKAKQRPAIPLKATMATAVVAAPAGKIPADPRGAQPVAPLKPHPFGPDAPAEVTEAIAELNERYNALHLEFERHFWGTKMALPDSTSALLAEAKTKYEAFLADADNLRRVEALLLLEGNDTSAKQLTEPQRRVLEVMRRTFRTYVSPGPEAAEIKAKLNELEADLSSRRNAMKLGMTTKKGEGGEEEFVAMSSVQLRNAMRVSEDEGERKAAYEGLCAIGPFVAGGLCEIVKLRNALARAQGHEDYYEFKVQAAEQVRRRTL